MADAFPCGLLVLPTRRLLGKHANAYEDGGANKGKGALSFMYEPPPGLAGTVDDPGAGGSGQGGQGGGKGGQEDDWEGEGGDKEKKEQGGMNIGAVNPLGLELRNVRCLKCKGWGHQLGDEECPMKAATVEDEKYRLQIEDPVMLFRDLSAGSKVTDRLVLRRGIDGRHGGASAQDVNQQILLSDEEDEGVGGGGVEEACRRRFARR